MPCIDKAIKHGRINDYLYEHVSNFTLFSFGNMFEAAGFEILRLERGYADEVVVAEVKPKQLPRLLEIKTSTDHYRQKIDAQFTNVPRTLEEWKKQKKKIAFWGGTGKSASFLNNFNIMAEDFPVVVDSDYNKVGRYALKPDYHLTLFHIKPDNDAVLDTKLFDKIIPLGVGINDSFKYKMLEQILAENYGIVLFSDVGLNRPSIILSNLRLAPIQITTYGHPVTSGNSELIRGWHRCYV